MTTSGKRIVLTSDEVTMSSFGDDAFQAFLCTFPVGVMGKFVQEYILPESDPDGSARFASYGLRKVEAVLKGRFGDDVVVCHPEHLSRFVGDDTRVIGVSCHDPLGLAYVSTTYNSILHFGGEAINYHYFKRLMDAPPLRRRDRKRTKLIAGGPGVWQISRAGAQDIFGIDTLLYGDAEVDLPDIVERILAGEDPGREVHMRRVDPETTPIPPITAPATFGCVEITRGCGRGCQFCHPTMRKRYSFPLDYIMKEVEVNIHNGNKSVFIVTEDIFLYRVGKNFVPNRGAVVELFRKIASFPGVEDIHLSHAAMAPVVCDPKVVEDITPYLLEKTRRRLHGRPYVTVEIGVETGSIRILRRGMQGKALPYRVEEWHDIIDTGLGILNDNSWYPLCTFMTASPDETEDDVLATLELMDRIKDRTLFYVPVIFIPITGTRWGARDRKALEHLSELQWEIITTGWRRNMRIWTDKDRYLYRGAAFFLYWFYLRWVHGPKTTVPFLKFMGFPEHMFARRTSMQCEPRLCGGREEVGGLVDASSGEGGGVHSRP